MLNKPSKIRRSNHFEDTITVKLFNIPQQWPGISYEKKTTSDWQLWGKAYVVQGINKHKEKVNDNEDSGTGNQPD